MKENLNCSGIYQIRNIVNGKVYVGSAQNFNIRWNRHKNELKNNIHTNRYLQNSWNKYGKENFIFEIIEFIYKIDNLIIKEQYWLDLITPYYKPIGYNINHNANNPRGVKRSAVTRKKMSLLRKGKNNHFYGKHLTKEHKQKISEAKKGRPSPNKGKLLSVKTRKKISETLKGNKLSEETKLKLSIAMKNRKILWKDKISEAHKQKIAKIHLQTNKIIKIYNSMTEAAESIPTNPGNISQCCSGRSKTSFNFIWRKVDKKTGDIIDPRNI